MAGLGYKNFSTGDVLTAGDVDNYLMEQTVMVFADAAARTTALTSVLAEGMISYLKDTNSTEYYSGSAWVAIAGAGGGMTSIASGSLSGSALSLSSISASYKNLQLVLRDIFISSSGASLTTRFNADATANAYNDQGINQLNGTASVVGQRSTESTSGFWSGMTNADNNNSLVINIIDYANATANKNITFFANYTSTSGSNVTTINCGWKNSAAINAISLTLSAGTFSGGTYVLYGVN